MKRYIVMHNNQRYIIEDSQQQKYVVPQPIEDIVRLSFDPDEQEFVISIHNPSNHTRYLYSQNRLGIVLSKHIVNDAIDHRSYGNEEGYGLKRIDATSYRLKSPTRKKYYKNWSRVYNEPVLVDDLNEVRIPIYEIVENRFGKLFPHGVRSRGYYTNLKALLCTVGIQRGFVSSSADRVYRTKSNVIKIRSIDTEFSNIYYPARIETEYQLLYNSNNQVYGCDIEITELTGWFRTLYENGKLGVSIKVYGPQWGIGSMAVNTGSWNRFILPKRISMHQEYENTESRHRGHRRKSCDQTITDLDFTFQWDSSEIVPKSTLRSMLNKHHDDIEISNFYSIVIFNMNTGTILHHVVDRIPYTYIDAY